MYAIRSYYDENGPDAVSNGNVGHVIDAREPLDLKRGVLVVITSYSIHYTKLYELKSPEQSRPPKTAFFIQIKIYGNIVCQALSRGTVHEFVSKKIAVDQKMIFDCKPPRQI